MASLNRAYPFRVFLLIWIGQNISEIGTQLTAFVLGVWVYRETNSVTLFALISFVATFPGALFLPLIGALVDRWDRRRIIILSDCCAGLVTLATFLLVLAGQLQVWHVYIIVGLYAFFSAFQGPAFAASITLLVPKEQYVRANGMVQAGLAVAQILSPMLAGVLIGLIGIEGVIAIDFATFLFAITILLIVRFPKVQTSPDGKQAKGSLWQESMYGWKYITTRPGLLGLLLFLAFVNFSMRMVIVLLTPLVLGFTSAATLGTILSISGVGLLCGGVLVSVWKGPVRKIHWIFGSVLAQALLLFLGGFQPNVPLVAAAAFLFMFCSPLALSASQAIWQSKVAPDVQGRVFAFRRMISTSSIPIAYLIAGPVADYIFEPLMASDGPLAPSLGQLIGTGTGRGIGLLFIVLGLLTVLVTMVFYLNPRVRLVEEELPDVIQEQERAALAMAEA